ncbi:LuxR C-terminal-related transcriptional regulator [Amycolatopsis silviterrae]|uniref:LuxR C-terminal-related transcriptional regulator n=1 Tax=Amycolatopsis silviterrae TaxID=1656914 RepID=A0ABW5H6F3_9PSEU
MKLDLDTAKVLLIERQTLFREMLQEVLSIENDIQIIGDAADEESAFSAIAQSRPDVVLVSLRDLGGLSGIIDRLHTAHPGCPVIVLTVAEQPFPAADILAMGVNGCLATNTTRQELVIAIRSVIAREDWFVLSVPRESLAARGDHPGSLSASPANQLSRRELEVLEQVSAGLSNNQIAIRLSIAEGTVKRHLRNIFAKLGAVSRIDAVNKATLVLPVA